MNRREFLKATGASSMALVGTSGLLATQAQANELLPLSRNYIFVHLGGGWDPTSYCDPKGNKLRGQAGDDDPSINPMRIRTPGKSVNNFPASAIRRARDVYIGSPQAVAESMIYAPYIGTYNNTDINGDIDDGSANGGFTTAHIQRVLAGTLAGNTLTAAPADVDWATVRSIQANSVEANARGILEGTINTIALNGIQDDLEDRNLNVNFGDNTCSARLFAYDAFACLHAHQMRIINGIDNRTNSHDTGTRYAGSGSLSAGYPDFSALYAAVNGADRPLAWMTDGGGNDESAGLVARSSASDAGFFAILADPQAGRVDFAASALTAAQAKRKSLQAQNERLPLRRQLQDQLYLVRERGGEFADVAQGLNNPQTPAEQAIEARATSGRRRHMRVGVAGFREGMASSMQVGFGGFDTHGNHDGSHWDRIRNVLEDLHFLFDAIDAYNVQDKVTVVVGSDFGRTPWYNDGNGKDHHNVTSYMLFGADVAGGTQINATNALVEAKLVNADLSPNSNGLLMTPSHLHRAMRRKAGLMQAEIALQFPVDAEDVDIFGT